MSKENRKSGNRVHNLNYHIVFCPKFRKKCLVGEVATRCEELMRHKCDELGCEVVALEVMPDHVHLFLAATPDFAPNHIIAQVKGATSRLLRQEFPHLLKMPSLWSRSYFANSSRARTPFLNSLKMPSLWSRSYFVGAVGHVSNTVVQAYIENQKGK